MNKEYDMHREKVNAARKKYYYSHKEQCNAYLNAYAKAREAQVKDTSSNNKRWTLEEVIFLSEFEGSEIEACNILKRSCRSVRGKRHKIRQNGLQFEIDRIEKSNERKTFSDGDIQVIKNWDGNVCDLADYLGKPYPEVTKKYRELVENRKRLNKKAFSEDEIDLILNSDFTLTELSDILETSLYYIEKALKVLNKNGFVRKKRAPLCTKKKSIREPFSKEDLDLIHSSKYSVKDLSRMTGKSEYYVRKELKNKII